MGPLLQSLWLESGKELEEAGIEDGVKEALSMVTRLMGGDVGQVVLRAQDPVPQNFDRKTFDRWIERRLGHEPLAYIFGEKEFFGRLFKVGPGALIPRPDTEVLVEAVLARNKERNFSGGLDLCSGPGTLGMTLCLELDLPFRLVELSEDAMSWAEENQTALGPMEVDLEQGDARKIEHMKEIDLIVCNPPYVEREAMDGLMADVRDFEPHLALDGGPGGLVFFYELLESLRQKAQKGCEIFVEVGADQRKLLEEKPPEGWTRHAWHKDLAGVDRVVHYLFSDEIHG